MKTIISGDLHNRWAKARRMYVKAGLIKTVSDDPFDDVRQPGFRHVQLGDAVSLGYGEVEANFYRWLFGVVGVDTALLGNHELPALFHSPKEVMFQGWYDKSEIQREVDRDVPRGEGDFWARQYPWMIGRDREAEILVRDKYREGRYEVATHVGDWLVTHAGLAARHQKKLGLQGASAEFIAAYLNRAFEHSMEHGTNEEFLTGCSEGCGGIMWLRFDYLRNGYDNDARTLPQIVGHTGYLGPKLYGSRLWNIDTPAPSKQAGGKAELGGTACLVTPDDGETFDLIYEA